MTNRLTHIILALFISLLIASCGDSGIRELSPKEFHMQLDFNKSYQLLDVCTAEEYQDKHIKSAVNVNFFSEYFENDISKLDYNKPIFVYCALGARSHEAAKVIQEHGYRDIFILEGGISAWRNAGLPVVGKD